MSYKFTTGNGGAGEGARGGDYASHNSSKTTNSHNKNSVHHRIDGDNYIGPVDQGDKFNGDIHNSAVGGRGNSNKITNNLNNKSGQAVDHQELSAEEIELIEQINKARKALEAKKKNERMQKLRDELEGLEAELEN